MTSFIDDWTYQELLNISKQHVDALDRTRMYDGQVAGSDNYAALMVSTVFAAIAIDAAVNDFILHYCLFVENPRVQEAIGEMAKHYLSRPIGERLKFVRARWPDEFPQSLIADINKLFQIRNQVAHQTNVFVPATKTDNGRAMIRNRPIGESEHMLRHYEIAHDFLSRFWLPGSRELNWPPTVSEETDASV